MTVKNLTEKLNLKIINCADDERLIKNGFCGDLLSWVMGRAKQDDVWVTIITNINIIAVATLADVSLIIIADNAFLSDEVINLAKEKEINLCSSNLSQFELCGLIHRLIKS
ncbi:MAG: hypothetical protein RR640_06330 [Oscillospiraceae bacterium]